MKRRAFILLLAAAPLARAQGKPRRIGFLGLASAKGPYARPLAALRDGLAKLGYVEGRDIAFEYRFAEERRERLPRLAQELVASGVDLIVAHGTPETRALQGVTGKVPIVMTSVGDPVGAKLVASLAHPGGNVTGLTNIDVGLAAKRLALLKEMLPKLARVGVLRNPANPSSVLQFEETQLAARALGFEIHLAEVREAAEFESAFAAFGKAGCGAVTVLADPLFLARPGEIAKLALAGRLPAIFARNENVEAGGLASYGPDLVELYRQAAAYVDKIFKGAKPGDLPIEQPVKFDLVINLRTAAALGIPVSKELRFRADRLIE